MAVRAFITHFFVVLAVALVTIFLAFPAQALMCFEDGAIKQFEIQHGEKPVAEGSVSDGFEMVLLLNPNSKSWSILIVRPDKAVCSLATGENFKLIKSSPSIEGRRT